MNVYTAKLHKALRNLASKKRKREADEERKRRNLVSEEQRHAKSCDNVKTVFTKPHRQESRTTHTDTHTQEKKGTNTVTAHPSIGISKFQFMELDKIQNDVEIK